MLNLRQAGLIEGACAAQQPDMVFKCINAAPEHGHIFAEVGSFARPAAMETRAQCLQGLGWCGGASHARVQDRSLAGLVPCHCVLQS